MLMERSGVGANEDGDGTGGRGELIKAPDQAARPEAPPIHPDEGSVMGPITLAVKCAGARSAGNPHATCDVAGVRNGITATSKRARRRKRWIQPRSLLRITAPALDPTAHLTHLLELQSGKG